MAPKAPKADVTSTEAPPAAKPTAKPSVIKTPVTLSTGAVVEFSPRQRVIKNSTLVDGQATVTFAFRNGEVRQFQFDKHAPLLMRLAIHGALQKIGDETAGVEDIDDQVTAVEATIARLEKGEWGAERQSASGFAGASTVIRAICEVKGITPEKAKAFIESTLAKYEAAGKPITRAAIYQSFRVPGTKTSVVIARLEAEKAAKAPDAISGDSLLEEFDTADVTA